MHRTWHEELESADPCVKGLVFALRFDSAGEAWSACQRGDWMLWYVHCILDRMEEVDRALGIDPDDLGHDWGATVARMIPLSDYGTYAEKYLAFLAEQIRKVFPAPPERA